MPNWPGYDFADNLIRTWYETMITQARIYNDAWGKLEAGNYELKHLLADSAKIYRHHFEAYRGVSTYGVRNVEWQQTTIGKDSVQTVSFEQPARVSSDRLAVSKADRTGGKDENGGTVTVELTNKEKGVISVNITTNDRVTAGDQWIAFVYDKTGGPPLGALLIHIA